MWKFCALPAFGELSAVYRFVEPFSAVRGGPYVNMKMRALKVPQSHKILKASTTKS